MEFSNRSAQTNQQPAAVHPAPSGHGGRKKDKGRWGRVGSIGMLAAIVILVVALILVIATGPKSESTYVDSSKLQAVFLNTGQVYFGNIKTLNNRYFVLTNIYYLQTSNSSGSSSATSSSNTNVTLVKLGCELHEPYDKMVINRDSVTFWENLQTGGQVAKAVATFQQQNPQGQKCADQSSSSSTNSSNSVQSAGNSATPSSSSSTPSTTNSSTTTKP